MGMNIALIGSAVPQNEGTEHASGNFDIQSHSSCELVR